MEEPDKKGLKSVNRFDLKVIAIIAIFLGADVAPMIGKSLKHTKHADGVWPDGMERQQFSAMHDESEAFRAIFDDTKAVAPEQIQLWLLAVRQSIWEVECVPEKRTALLSIVFRDDLMNTMMHVREDAISRYFEHQIFSVAKDIALANHQLSIEKNETSRGASDRAKSRYDRLLAEGDHEPETRTLISDNVLLQSMNIIDGKPRYPNSHNFPYHKHMQSFCAK
jgi:hypothetical protein